MESLDFKAYIKLYAFFRIKCCFLCIYKNIPTFSIQFTTIRLSICYILRYIIIYISKEMLVGLSESKKQGLRNRWNIENYPKYKNSGVRKNLSFLTFCCPAVNYVWAYKKACEREKYLALEANKNNHKNGKMMTFKNILGSSRGGNMWVYIYQNQLERLIIN